MKKVLIFLLLVSFSSAFSLSVQVCEGADGTVIGLSRNPDSCYPCHSSHIMTYHNENFFSAPKPLDMDCNICHDHIQSVPDISCDACHQSHDFNKLKFDRAVGTWSMTGPMEAARFYNSSSLLPDGSFLVAGGATPPYFMASITAEILDPQTRVWTSTEGSMSTSRISHQQSTLQDGTILITAGRSQISPFIPGAAVLDSAEIYDPATDMFISAGTLNIPRRSHRDILLDDGRVLITGGTSAITGDQTSISLASAEIYDPETSTFSLLPDMNVARQSHHLVKLLDGRVLVIGGGEGPGLANPTPTMEIFDPDTDTFTPAASMNNARLTCAVSLLADGKVLLAFSWDGLDVTNAAEIYDPETDTVTPVSGTLPVHGKVDNLAVRLYDDTVICPTGGNEYIQVLPDTSVYRPNKDDFILAGSVQFPRTTGYNTGALLPDGRIITAGGIGLTSAGAPRFYPIGEIYTPSDLQQAKGLKNVIGDIPKNNFDKKSHKADLKDKVKDVIELLKCDGKQEQAKNILVNKIIPHIDGCADGDPSDDWIVSCDDQEIPNAVATRLVMTLDEILGILQPPQINIEADQTEGGYPLTVSFTATAIDPDGSVISYYWEFGDGRNSIAQNPANTYSCPGTYTAILAVIDNDGLLSQEEITISVGYPEGISSSYQCDLAPSYNAFCAKVCHYTNAPEEVGAGVDLSSYDAIMAGRTLPDGTVTPIVIPGDPDNSPIVIYTDPPAYHAKDVGGERLNDTVQEKQRAWIEEGAQNN